MVVRQHRCLRRLHRTRDLDWSLKFFPTSWFRSPDDETIEEGQSPSSVCVSPCVHNVPTFLRTRSAMLPTPCLQPDSAHGNNDNRLDHLRSHLLRPSHPRRHLSRCWVFLHPRQYEIRTGIPLLDRKMDYLPTATICWDRSQ